MRAVTDHDVDRMQVYRWRHHSRALLIARTFCVRVMHVDGCPDSGCVFCIVMPCFFPVCLADAFQVMIARRFHLFPSRTEKLSFVTPMVLPFGGRVGSRRFTFGCRGPVTNSGRAPFFCGCVTWGCPGHAPCFFNEGPFMEFIFVPAFWENVLSFLWKPLLVSVDKELRSN